MKEKFTEEYIKGILSGGFNYEGVYINSRYRYDYNKSYDKNFILNIFNEYSEDYTSLSLLETKQLYKYLGDLIEYYERFNRNPTLLTIDDKKKMLLEKIKEDNTSYVLVLSLNELPEDKLDKILKHLKLV